MPLSQTRNEHEKSKETVQKTKRCGSQHRKNRFLLLSTKEDSNRAKARSTDKDINVGISKQNSDNHTPIKNAKYSQEKSTTSKRIVAETHKDEMRTLKDDLNEEEVIINMNSQEKTKKCNTEKCVCHCKEDCKEDFSSASKKSSSRMLGSSRIDKSERTNHRRLTKYENAKPNILQQKLPKLYYESPHELHVPNLINYFPIQPYQEKINNIPSVPVLYEITPNISPHMIGNTGKYVNVGIPFTSFEGRPNHLVGNTHNQYQSIIHQKPYICSPITGRHQVESSVVSVTSPSTNYIDATTIKETTNNLENNPIDITGEDQERFPELITEASNIDASAETETNLQLNHSTDVTEESNAVSSVNLNKVMHKSEDFTEEIERNPDNNLSELTTHSTDYVGISNAPSVIYDGMNDGKLINMEECIQLFGRDVCVLSATSPKMLVKQAQRNNLNRYSTIRIPEYVTQIFTKKETTSNNINYSDKFKTTDLPYFASESSINGMNKLNVNLNEYLESTKIKPNDADEASLSEFHQYPTISTKQMSEPDDKNDNKNKLFNIIKNTDTPIKKLMNPIDEAVKMEKNKLLGKSKSHTTKLLLNPNDEEIANSTSGEKLVYSTPSYESSNDEEANNLKVIQQNRITNTNSILHTSPEKDTVTSYDKIGYDSKEENYLKESNMDIYSGKNAPQEYFKEEITTTNSNSKIDNFEETTEKEIIGIKASIDPGEIHQEQSTTMQYFDDKKSRNLNNKEDTIKNLEEIIESSTSRLPFCDNTLLLNSIRKVINDFASDPRLIKTKDLDENSLQTQGKNLLSEILQVPNLKNILSTPQIENTIVEKVKNILSYVTAIPRKDFTNKWSHGVIRNTLRSILDTFSDVHHKLPPMTLEEHQFKDEQWKTNLVTLAPVSDQKLSMSTSDNLRESIKDLLSSSAIASQTDQYIVRNMIVQSVKNSLTNDEDDKIDDSIIHALNDVLQTLKERSPENINTLERSNEVISDEEDMNMTLSQEMPTNNYEIGINVDNDSLNSKQNLDVNEDIKMDSERMQITDYQKAKILENNANILITSESPYLQLYEEERKEETTNKAIIKENIRDQNLDKIKEINVQDDAEKKLTEPLKPKIIYHKAILHNNRSVLAFEPNSTRTEQYIEKNYRIDEGSVKDTITITNFVQETSPSYAQVSDGIILENMVEKGAKDIEEEVQHSSNEKTLTTSTDKINPLIILERIKFNLPPTKYYSPEILKHATNHHIDDKNFEITTASTNFIQETSSNYAQVSDDMDLQNIAETKDKMEYPLTTTSDNLISFTNVDLKTDKNILESQQQKFTEDNVIKIHEVTTEVQRTYAKTTYFKAEPYSDSPRISSPSLTYETTDIRINNNNDNKNSGNNSNNLIDNKMNNVDNTKAKEVIVTSSKLSAVDDIYPPQLLPSSIASDDISELQRSQLYYISDDVKLPLEIKTLKDGSYALSISKNVCEQILTRKCPCCVPLQGYIVSLKNHQREDTHTTSTTMEKKDQENIYVNNRDYQSVQPLSSMIMKRNVLKTQKSKEEEKEAKEERINAHYLWKQNDNDLTTIPMPVIDFAKKYNLLLDFNEERILPSSLKSVKGFEHDQSEEKKLNNYPDIKKNRLLGENNDAIDKSQDLINVREKKNIPNFPIFPITRKIFNLEKNSREFEIRRANAEMNQSEINQESKLCRVKTANDVQNMNIVQKINSENQKKMDPVLERINISEESKISKEETKWNKLSDNVEGNYHITHNKN